MKTYFSLMEGLKIKAYEQLEDGLMYSDFSDSFMSDGPCAIIKGSVEEIKKCWFAIHERMESEFEGQDLEDDYESALKGGSNYVTECGAEAFIEDKGKVLYLGWQIFDGAEEGSDDVKNICKTELFPGMPISFVKVKVQKDEEEISEKINFKQLLRGKKPIKKDKLVSIRKQIKKAIR